MASAQPLLNINNTHSGVNMMLLFAGKRRNQQHLPCWVSNSIGIDQLFATASIDIGQICVSRKCAGSCFWAVADNFNAELVAFNGQVTGTGNNTVVLDVPITVELVNWYRVLANVDSVSVEIKLF